MAKESKISWTMATQNFWVGCHKKSAGCNNCYMYRGMNRYGKDPAVVMRTSDKTFYAPLKWKEPRVIFTCSWSDYFIEDANEWRAEAWNVIRNTPQHIYLILTKRHYNIKKMLPEDWGMTGEKYPHVWIGVTVEDRVNTDRIEILQSVIQNERLFISCEPLLENIADLVDYYLSNYNNIGWIIAGGESGHNARKCEVKWLMQMDMLSEIYGIPLFIKQLGSYLAKKHNLKHFAGADRSEWAWNLPQEYPSQIAKLMEHSNI